jgi:Fe2+ or Zn2+ uptake regulation protein
MDAISDLTHVTRLRGSRLTRQRRLVLDILKENPGHLDAGMIYQEAKKRDVRISLATVYRSLALLKAAGLVAENRLGEDHAHFEPLQEPQHYHFTCRGCGKVIEFEAAGIAAVVQELCEREGLQVSEIHFRLRGCCPDCQAREPQP